MRSSLVLAALLIAAAPAHAFCGFFVAKADAQLFNKSSQVALVRDGDRTVVTMGNDYSGPLGEFALVVPVPSVLKREQIHVGDRALLSHLDNYSSPRLVETTDENPCELRRLYEAMAMSRAAAATADRAPEAPAGAALGVKVEAEYTVGEYDIVLLSASQSAGLETWLNQNGYRIPPRAAAALEPYIKQDMKFFVARVNLKEQAKTGFQELRPLQIAYESPKFMLPIRLGMANSPGEQDLIVYALSRQGRVESTNYQTVKIPSDVEVPEFVQQRFAPFYTDVFAREWRKHDQRAVITEYAWNMASCDPCAAPPLDRAELKALGVFWLDDSAAAPFGGAAPVTLTRLHVRYDAAHFPEDLVFQETGDQQPFQGRYVVRHPARGDLSCEAGRRYQQSLTARRGEEARTLAGLTGWDPADIRRQMGPDAPPAPNGAWWRRIWQ